MKLKDIAERVGVSISTVSRVINNKDTKAASQEVQEKIWSVVRETGYTPNIAARNLKLGEVNKTATISENKSLACIVARSRNAIDEPFFLDLSHAIEKEAFKQGYVLRYTFSAFDLSNSNTFNTISNTKVDGVIVLGRFNLNLSNFIKKHYKNVVFAGLNSIDSAYNYDQVVCDGYKASIAAVKHLTTLHHTNISYIGETQNEIRFKGFIDAMKELCLSVNSQNIIDTHLSTDGGYKGAKKLLEAKTSSTAIFCANDITAIGALKAIKEKGLRVPEDISIISIDDIDMAQYISPMLTTVHIPINELGKMAAKTLIDRIEHGHDLPIKLEIPFNITKRESCAIKK
ncbi:LacI family DNA-binding transcriptional regulator [Clostridium saccharoperbutylacetonicum]